MKKRFMKITGALLSIIGAFLITIQPFSPITGAVIDLSTKVSIANFIAGLSMIIIGIILFSIATVEERATSNIIYTDRFRKETKRIDPRMINRAINKIGTGLAHEEHLNFDGGYTVRVDKGARLHYERSPDGRIILTGYEPSSRHG